MGFVLGRSTSTSCNQQRNINLFILIQRNIFYSLKFFDTHKEIVFVLLKKVLKFNSFKNLIFFLRQNFNSLKNLNQTTKAKMKNNQTLCICPLNIMKSIQTIKQAKNRAESLKNNQRTKINK
jgi:hypothetical protein